MTISYYIQIPSKLAADLTQKYGNINLPNDNNGKTDIHLKYGNLNAGNFISNLAIEAQYGNVEVGNIQNAQLDLSYVGKASIKNGKDLNIDSKYSNVNISTTDQLNIDLKYGNFTIENISKINAEMKYSDGKIGSLKQSLSVGELSYSNLTINELSSSFDKVNVEAHYGNLNIRIPAKSSFKITAEDMKYGNCDVNGFNVTKKNIDNEDKSYTYEINGGGQRSIYFEGNKYGNLKVKAF